jgi:Family of unknown function (DUF5522)
MADQTNPATAPLALPSKESAPTQSALTEEDFYYEGPYLVFTAVYHVKRGYCCNSTCRHCPYQEADES